MKNYKNDPNSILPNNTIFLSEIKKLKHYGGAEGVMPKSFFRIENKEITLCDFKESDFIVKFPISSDEDSNANEHFFLWLSRSMEKAEMLIVMIF